MLKNAELPKEMQGFVITDRIQIGGNDYVIGFKENHPINPYVVWSVDYDGKGFSLGHYFKEKEDAMLDIFKRASRGIEFPEEKSLAVHLLDEYDQNELREQFRKEALIRDIEANLVDYLDYEDLEDVETERFLNNPYFMETMMHQVGKVDYSDINDSIRYLIEDTIRDEFPDLLPELYPDAKPPLSTYPFELVFSKDAYAFLDDYIRDYDFLKKEDPLLPESFTIAVPSTKNADNVFRVTIDPVTYEDVLVTFRLALTPNHEESFSFDHVKSMDDLLKKVEEFYNDSFIKEEYKLHLIKDFDLDRVGNWYQVKMDYSEKTDGTITLPKGTNVKVIDEGDSRNLYDEESGMPNRMVETEWGKTFIIPDQYLSSKSITHLMEMKKAPLTSMIAQAEAVRQSREETGIHSPSMQKDMEL